MSKDNNEKDHYLHKGKKVPRTSSIIKLLAKDGLVYWANMLGLKKKKVKEELDKSANIGTMVHGMIEEYGDPIKMMFPEFKFKDFGIEDEESAKQVYNAYKSYVKFAKEFPDKTNVIHRELSLTCSKFGGTIDAIVKEDKSDEGVVIMDYKTSKDFYDTMFIQLGAYIILYEQKNKIGPVKGCRVLLLDRKDGDIAKERYFSREDMEPYVSIFNSLIELYYALEKIK